MHAHIGQLVFASDVVAVDPVVASLIASLTMLFGLVGLGKVLFDSARLDDGIRVAVAVVGIGGFLAQVPVVRIVSDAIQTAITAVAKDNAPWVYTVIFGGLVAWLGWKYFRASSWKTLFWLSAALTPLFASGQGQLVVSWYQENIGVRVFNMLVGVMQWLLSFAA